MRNSRPQKYISALIGGKRPGRFGADPETAQLVRTAITLQSARTDLAEPSERFMSDLFDELAASHRSEPAATARSFLPRRRAGLLAAAAAVGLVAGTFGVTEAVDHRGHAPAVASTSPAGALHSAALLDAQHQPEGTINLYGGDPAWIFMTIHQPGYNGIVTCQLQGQDGHVLLSGSFAVNGGSGEWARTISVNPAQVKSARIVTTTGITLASAELSSS